MAYLTVRIKDTDGHSFTELNHDRMVVGRSSRTEIPIKHTSISREHCAFVKEQDAWYVEDLGSSNGTWVNNERITRMPTLKVEKVDDEDGAMEASFTLSIYFQENNRRASIEASSNSM